MHTGLGRRNPGECALLHGCMAEAAVDPEAADMMLVAEGDRLLPRDPDFGDIGGAVEAPADPERGGNDEECPEDADFREGVGARMEDLGHRSAPSSASVDAKATLPRAPAAGGWRAKADCGAVRTA